MKKLPCPLTDLIQLGNIPGDQRGGVREHLRYQGPLACTLMGLDKEDSNSQVRVSELVMQACHLAIQELRQWGSQFKTNWATELVQDQPGQIKETLSQGEGRGRKLIPRSLRIYRQLTVAGAGGRGLEM